MRLAGRTRDWPAFSGAESQGAGPETGSADALCSVFPYRLIAFHDCHVVALETRVCCHLAERCIFIPGLWRLKESRRFITVVTKCGTQQQA